MGERYEEKDYFIEGRPVHKRGILTVLYGNNTAEPPQLEIEKKVFDFYEKGFNATNIEILKTVMKFNTHFFPTYTRHV